MPSEGPAAARFNPARLAEVRLASLAYGHFGTASGKSGIQFVQAAIGTPWDVLRWPVGLAAGFGFMDQGNPIDGTNGVYTEAEYDPGLAVRFPADPESRYNVEAGLNFAISEYDAFNVTHSVSLGIDAGALFSVHGGAGLFGLGLAYHDLNSPRIRMPDDYGPYKVPGWLEPSLEWISAADRVHAHLSYFINESNDPQEGPSSDPVAGVNGWDIEYRPIPWLGLKAERTRIGSRAMLGAVWRPALHLEHAHAFLEFEMGHDKFGPGRLIPSPLGPFLFGDPGEDEGRGYQLAVSLGAEI